MPKRKRVKYDEDDYEYLEKWLRKLERSIKSGRKRHRDSSLSSVSDNGDNLSLRNPEECDSIANVDDGVSPPEVGCSYWNDWPEPSEPHDVDVQAGIVDPCLATLPAAHPHADVTLSPSTAVTPASVDDTPLTANNVRSIVIPLLTSNVAAPQNISTAPAPLPSTTAVVMSDTPPPLPVAELQNEVPTPALDPDLLAILGEDPTAVKEYGDDIQNDLAIRLNHLVTSGLSKENRKEIKDKYLIPGNCKMIKAPTLNPEIRASLIESQAKRDKGIENKQVLNSCALSSLSKAITLILSSDDKNQEVLRLLMDTARILGDMQHSDSLLRRFFILSTVKKELRDQLEKTKIEDLLFGSNLAETLKSARTISKSGADMRAATGTAKIGAPKPVTIPNRPLNSRAPPMNRRPAPAGGARQARPTTQPAPTPRQPTTTRHNSKTLSRQQYPRHRR